MTKRESMQKSAEKLAEKAICDTMNQRIDDDTLKAVAERIFYALPKTVRQAA